MNFLGKWKRIASSIMGGGNAPAQSTSAKHEQRHNNTCNPRIRQNEQVDKGLLVFHNTSEVIRAERLLRESGLAVDVMGPPPDLRTGCDMVLVFPLVSELAARHTLEEAGLIPLQVLPLYDLLLEPVSLFHSTWFGPYLMVRAANMKITVRLEPQVSGGCTARIVNISGGGCPDVPYLASLLVGKTLEEADEPRVHGRTLCSYSLQKAFEETRRVTAELRECPERISPSPPPCLKKEKHPRQTAVLNPRPWLVCGTVPDDSFPLMHAHCALKGDVLVLTCEDGGSVEVPVRRGTPALLAAAVKTCEALGVPGPETLLVGDAGRGDGSRLLYRKLACMLTKQAQQKEAVWAGLTFHYLFPDVDGHNQVLMAVEDLDSVGLRPVLVADAGFMYAAKMSGYAASYDLFTPDAGELAFLADEKAPHPFYTRGFLLAGEQDVPELAHKAQLYGNSAQHLLVKGAKDSFVQHGEILDVVDSPCIPAMEPIGGTGDFVTGMVTAFLAAGLSMRAACMSAAYGNRYVGEAACPSPDTQVADLLPFVVDAVRRIDLGV